MDEDLDEKPTTCKVEGEAEKKRKVDSGEAVKPFGPDSLNTHLDRPKSFSDIKNCILDGEGT